jgi:hypothetical protein
MNGLRIVLLGLVAEVLCNTVLAQPSSAITVRMRMYDTHGQLLTKDIIKKNYVLIDKSYNDEPYYDTDSNGYLVIVLGNIYAPYNLIMAHNGDTMRLCFATDNLDRVIHHITFTPGNYFFSERTGNRKDKNGGETRVHKRVNLAHYAEEWRKYSKRR